MAIFFPLFTDWYLNLWLFKFLDLYLSAYNTFLKSSDDKTKEKPAIARAELFLLFYRWAAKRRIDWVACSRPDINAMAVSCCNRGLVNSYPTQPHPRQSAIAYKCIQQFQISSRAACVHRNSNTTKPVEILMRKPDLEKRKPFVFVFFIFIS